MFKPSFWICLLMSSLKHLCLLKRCRSQMERLILSYDFQLSITNTYFINVKKPKNNKKKNIKTRLEVLSAEIWKQNLKGRKMSTFNLHPFKTTFKFLSSNLSSNVLERISLALSTVLFLFKVKGYLWRRLLNGLTQKTKIGGVCDSVYLTLARALTIQRGK